MKPRTIEGITGKKFNRLTVIKFVGIKEIGIKHKTKHRLWLCRCDCGKIKELTTNNLACSHVTSCGCSRYGEKGKGGLDDLFSEYKRAAKKYKREFNLTKEEFKFFTSNTCFYCGENPSSIKIAHPNRPLKTQENEKYIYNGLDRKDNFRGYSIDNIVTCCKWCNIAKRDRTYEEYLSWVIKSYKHQNKGD